MIRDQHERALLVLQVDSTSGIREHDRFHTEMSQSAHAESYFGRSVAFVEVITSGHHGQFQIAQPTQDQFARMSDGGRFRPSWNMFVGNLSTVREFIRKRTEPAAEHDGDSRSSRGRSADVRYRVVH